MASIGHLALGVYGFGCEDALTHLLNYLWPNVFETSPHVVQAFMSCMEGMRIGLGPAKILQYSLQVIAFYQVRFTVINILVLLTFQLVHVHTWFHMQSENFSVHWSNFLLPPVTDEYCVFSIDHEAMAACYNSISIIC